MKRLVSLTLAVLMVVLAIPMSAFAQTSKATDIVKLNGTEQTITLDGVTYQIITSASQVTSANGNYYLANDITITAPIFSGGYFTGKFNGGGHMITLNGAKTVFDKTLGGANCIVSNFTVKGADVTLGQYAGILAPSCTNGGTYYNITNEVNIISDNSQNYMFNGGLFGAIADAATADLTFEKCVNKGNITSGKAGIAGIFGGVLENANKVTVSFINCSNSGVITGAEYTGGIMGTNNSGKVNFVFDGCNNSGKIVSKSAVAGGILAGNGNGPATEATYTISNCHNTAEISSKNNAIGGIMGGTWSAYKVSISIENCTNSGNVSTTSDFGVGGILGYINYPKDQQTIHIANCVNTASVSSKSSYVGGIWGGCHDAQANLPKVTLIGCINAGEIYTTSYAEYCVGGIAGGISGTNARSEISLSSCVNLGDVTTTGQYASGIYGYQRSSNNYEITLKDCYNAGTITTTGGYKASEFVNIKLNSDAYTASLTIKNCYSLKADNQYYAEGGTITKNVSGNGTCSAEQLVQKANNVIDCNALLYLKDGKVSVCVSHSFAGELLSNVCSVCGHKVPYTGYIQLATINNMNYVRFVMVISEEEIENAEYEDFTMTATVNGRFIKVKASELSAYESVEAAGKTYTAAEGFRIFGVVINLESNVFETARAEIVASDENETILYDASVKAQDFLPPTVDPVDPNEKVLKVGTYNVYHFEYANYNYSTIANDIKSKDLEIVGLQEVDNATVRSSGKNQAEELANALGWQYYKFAKAKTYQGGGYGHCIVSKYPIESFKVVELPNKTGMEQRVFGHAVINVNGYKINFINTHLTLDEENTGTPTALRLSQFKALADYVENLDNFIITGDFNTADFTEYSAIKNATLLNNSANNVNTFPATGLKKSIDNIVVSNNFTLGKPKTLVNDHSDHIMLYTEIKYIFSGN